MPKATDAQISAFQLQCMNDEFDCDTYDRMIACRGGFLLVFHSGRGLLFRASEGDVGIQEINPDMVEETVRLADVNGGH